MSDEAATGGERIAIGYCHQCDRQVPLVTSDQYQCSRCNGGFVEILDETTIAQQAEQRQQQQRDASHRPANRLPFPNILLSSNFMGGQQQPHGHTRVQLIVPGEQFDLYGVMNQVLGDLFNPRGSAGGNAAPFQLHPLAFQLHGDIRDYAFSNAGLDAIITQLLGQLENSGPPPATEQQLKNLPVVVISQAQIDENVQCAICMEDYKLSEEARQLPCKHFFHESCISQWLKLHGTCPVCRKTLSGEDTSQREYVRPADHNANNATQAQPEQQNRSSNEPPRESGERYYDPDFD